MINCYLEDRPHYINHNHKDFHTTTSNNENKHGHCWWITTTTTTFVVQTTLQMMSKVEGSEFQVQLQWIMYLSWDGFCEPPWNIPWVL